MEGVREPPFRFEVHLKRKTLIVTISQLHHIAPGLLNLDESSDSALVLDTTKSRRKYRLFFPFPSGMKVDSSSAEYTYDAGELVCSFPIKVLPSDVEANISAKIQEVKDARRLRFRYNHEGNLVVRSRRGVLSTEESSAKQPRRNDAAEDPPQQAPQKKSRVDSAVKADSTTSRIAAECAKNAQATLKEKLSKARAEHLRRVQAAESKHVQKEERRLQVDQRLAQFVEERKKTVAAKIAEAVPKRKERKKSGKSVSFLA